MEIECPDGWKLVSLRELGEVNRGRSRHRPRYAEHLYGGPYPFIQTGDVKASNGRVTSHTQSYTEAGLAQSRLWPTGTMCITIAANIAETGILTFPACFPDSVVGFVAEPKKADVQFVEYMFRFMRSRIQHQATGSVQDNINIETLERLHFPIPPLAEQKAIAAVLGALDDKIELNRRMNATLEAMARALFQSWFVDFDPVRAKLDGRKPVGLDATAAALFPDSFQDSELGHIPNGWTAGKLGNIGANSRLSIRPNEIAPNTPYIALEHMPRRCIALGDWDDSAHVASGKSSFKKGEILFGKLRPYFHKVGVAPFDGVCSTDILVLAPKSPEWFGFLLGHLSSDELIQFTDLASTGTKMPRTNWGDISSFTVALPPKPIAAAFTCIIQSMLDHIHANLYQSRTLATLRDTLLPKLLSGELPIPAN
jgi:type I restriction enzyme, S subunit